MFVRLPDCVRTANVDHGGNYVDTITDLVPTPMSAATAIRQKRNRDMTETTMQISLTASGLSATNVLGLVSTPNESGWDEENALCRNTKPLKTLNLTEPSLQQHKERIVERQK